MGKPKAEGRKMAVYEGDAEKINYLNVLAAKLAIEPVYMGAPKETLKA
jgi:hypothetical protein